MQNVFIVDEIVSQRTTTCGGVEYLVKWWGYSNADNSWEPAENVESAAEAIAQFKELQESDPKLMNWGSHERAEGVYLRDESSPPSVRPKLGGGKRRRPARAFTNTVMDMLEEAAVNSIPGSVAYASLPAVVTMAATFTSPEAIPPPALCHTLIKRLFEPSTTAEHGSEILRYLESLQLITGHGADVRCTAEVGSTSQTSTLSVFDRMVESANPKPAPAVKGWSLGQHKHDWGVLTLVLSKFRVTRGDRAFGTV